MSNAHKFVAEKCVEEAKRVLSGAPDWATNFNQKIGYTKASNGGEYTVYKNQINGGEEYSLHYEMGFGLEKLKQVVDSLELVKEKGGLTKYQFIIVDPMTMWDTDLLQKAIDDYELVEKYKGEQNG